MHRLQSLRTFLQARLQPEYLVLAASSIVVMGFGLALALFWTSDQGQTAFGIPLGADFAGFYVAAEILNRGQSNQLYDRALHDQIYHELLPHEEAQASIPYVHPPFVAGMFRLLACLPYSTAFAVWLLLTAVLYVAAIFLLLKTIPWPNRRQNSLIVLLAMSFEPFLFECWLGGQLSVVAFSSFALCYAAMQHNKSYWAGAALGLCFYKPTLLMLVLPMLVIGQRWQMLLGMLMTGMALGLLSIVLVGWNVSFGYLNVLLAFRKSMSGGDLEIRTWKYVDLNNCLRLILGNSSAVQRGLLVAIGLIPFGLLLRIWSAERRLDADCRRLLWATTMTWIPILNLYFGIYDSILIVQSLLITAGLLCTRGGTANPLTRSGFAELVLAISVAPWFSQNLAAKTGVPLYSLLITGLGCCQLYWIFSLQPELLPFSRRSSQIVQE